MKIKKRPAIQAILIFCLVSIVGFAFRWLCITYPIVMLRLAGYIILAFVTLIVWYIIYIIVLTYRRERDL